MLFLELLDYYYLPNKIFNLSSAEIIDFVDFTIAEFHDIKNIFIMQTILKNIINSCEQSLIDNRKSVTIDPDSTF